LARPHRKNKLVMRMKGIIYFLEVPVSVDDVATVEGIGMLEG
jgi:hypothetical protein